MNEHQKQLVLDWMRKIHRMEWTHRFEAKKWKAINVLLGVVSIVLATVMAAISTIPSIDDLVIKYTVSIGAIIVAILSGLQTFLKPSEMAEKFGKRSDEYEAIRHRLEELFEFHDVVDQDFLLELEKVRESWKGVASMNASDRSFKKAGVVIQKDNRYPTKLDFQRQDEKPNKAN